MTLERTEGNGSFRRAMVMLAALLAGLTICIGFSCGPTAEQRYQQQMAQTGKPAMHAIQSNRLRELMHRLTYSMTLDPPDRFTEPARRAKQVAEVASQMAATARNVAQAESKFHLSPADRVVFLKMAEKLQSSAEEISECASRQNYDCTRSAIQEMQSTCNACHSLFRSSVN